MTEERDETHVEQHGDGDVNITSPEPGSDAPAEQEQGGEQQDADSE